MTTEVFLRGPTYVDLWISIGVDVEAGRSLAVTYDAVRTALTTLPRPAGPESAAEPNGWPLGKAVHRLELAAVASRVPGVRLVSDVRVAAGSGGPTDVVLGHRPRAPAGEGHAVGAEAADLDQVRGQQAPPNPPAAVPVPIVPEDVLMDANGTRLPPAPGRARLAGQAAPTKPADSVVYDPVHAELTLCPQEFHFVTGHGDRPPSLRDRRGAAVDAYGNIYWVADSETAGLGPVGRQRSVLDVLATGAGHARPPAGHATIGATGRLRARDRRRCRRAGADQLAGLAVTEDHYLVVGTQRPGRASSSSTCTLRRRRATTGGRPASHSCRSTCAPEAAAGCSCSTGSSRRLWELDRRLQVVSRGGSSGSPGVTATSARWMMPATRAAPWVPDLHR